MSGSEWIAGVLGWTLTAAVVFGFGTILVVGAVQFAVDTIREIRREG